MITKERLDELLSYDPETGIFTWRIDRGNVKAGSVAGRRNTGGHIQIGVSNKVYLAHRLAFLMMVGSFPPNQVDHINGVRDDNRWVNLRPATNAENCRNQCRRTSNTSGVTGVSWHTATGKWCAVIRVGSNRVHLGLFVEFEDAVAARRAAEVKYFGEFSATTSRKVLDADPAAC